MLISREVDYALRVLRALQDGAMQSCRQLFAAQYIPEAFGYKVVGKLARSGFVENTRGAAGGVILRRDLSQSTLYDVLTAVEAEQRVSRCTDCDYQCAWRQDHQNHCGVHDTLCQLEQSFKEQLQQINLADMLSEHAPEN